MSDKIPRDNSNDYTETMAAEGENLSLERRRRL